MSEGFAPGRHAIDGYGAMGFSFAGMTHRGSVLALPSGIHGWSAVTAADITTSALADLFAETAPIDLVLIGTGPELVPLPAPLRARFRERGIGVEVMATGPAARTYNVLAGEGRRVAAALLAVP